MVSLTCKTLKSLPEDDIFSECCVSDITPPEGLDPPAVYITTFWCYVTWKPIKSHLCFSKNIWWKQRFGSACSPLWVHLWSWYYSHKQIYSKRLPPRVGDVGIPHDPIFSRLRIVAWWWWTGYEGFYCTNSVSKSMDLKNLHERGERRRLRRRRTVLFSTMMAACLNRPPVQVAGGRSHSVKKQWHATSKSSWNRPSELFLFPVGFEREGSGATEKKFQPEPEVLK